MNGPSKMQPWYVVQKLGKRGDMLYFHSVDSGSPFRPTKGTSLLFTNFLSAVQVAEVEVAEIRVLYNDEGSKEFGR